MAAKKKEDVYIATDSGSAEIKGQTYSFHKGITRVAGDHPLAKMDFFEPAAEHLQYEVEQATAAPGEKRRAGSRARKSAARSTAKSATATKPSGLSLSSLKGE